MAELQSCSKYYLGFETQQIVSQLSAELKREKQKNAELMEKICMLEAQIQQREKAYQEQHSIDTDRSLKRQKTESKTDAVEDTKIAQCCELVPEIKHVDLFSAPKDTSKQNRLLSWMTTDNTQFLDNEKLGDANSAVNCDDTDDTDEDDEYCDEDDADVDVGDSDSDWKNKLNIQVADTSRMQMHEGVDSEKQTQYLENIGHDPTELRIENVIQELKGTQNKELLLPHIRSNTSKKDQSIHRRKESKMTWGCKELLETQVYGREVEYKGHGNVSLHKKPPKVPFCPKEVNRIIGLEELQLKNAQSHTIRKLIVFASLGIRHGSEDMYELEFNHFSILQKGEPYVSPMNPGEHVLYEHPGTRRKVFYPNTQNPTLCPVQILEEEKAMRPLDANCPSCLFLCIKYGGRTRNLPQNEYVRQRMGRNKLKSFGPLMCKMAMLIHIRSGSFFFKALGITLLFMHGFSEELVQRETKYRNLDLLQKYYRKDDDAAVDELFHLHPTPYDTQASPILQPLASKATKSSGKKQTGPACKSSTPVPCENVPSSSAPPTQFGLLGYVSLPTHQAMGSLQSIPSQSITPVTSSPISTSPSTLPYNTTGQVPSPYPMLPPQPANTFMPMLYWSHPNSFPSWYPYPSPTPYGYPSFPPRNCISLHQEPPSYMPFAPKVVQDSDKYIATVGEAHSDSEGGSTSTKSKKPPTG